MPAAAGTVNANEQGPFIGVVGASVPRRSLAILVDVALPLALVVLAVGASTKAWASASLAPLFVAGAVAVVVVTLVALTTRGRSLGRWLLRQRTVDDITATPARAHHLLRQLFRATRPLGLMTADLRLGRDPITPLLITPGLGAATAVDPSSTLAQSAGGGTAAPQNGLAVETRRSVGIVLDSGERYEIQRSLVIGRSPVDPVPGMHRALLAWPDLSRRLAKAHVLLEWSGTTLWVTDLNSGTGSVLVTAGGDRQPLVPGVPASAAVGSLVICGGRSIKVVPHG